MERISKNPLRSFTWSSTLVDFVGLEVVAPLPSTAGVPLEPRNPKAVMANPREAKCSKKRSVQHHGPCILPCKKTMVGVGPSSLFVPVSDDVEDDVDVDAGRADQTWATVPLASSTFSSFIVITPMDLVKDTFIVVMQFR